MNLKSIRSGVALSIALAAAGTGAQATAPGGDSPPPGLADDYPIPTGSKEDVALWKRLIVKQNAITTSRDQALKLLWKLEQSGYDRKLQELAAKGPPDATAKVEALRKRFLAAWSEDHQTLTSQWPVDPRLGCRAERLDFEAALGSKDSVELSRTRAAAIPCLDKMELAVNRMERANRELLAVVAEVEAALAVAPPAAPAAGGRS